MGEQNPVHSASIEPGELVYDSDGRLVGRVSGITDDGFEAEEVEPGETAVGELPGKEFGEGYLMWECTECGQMGELDEGLPGSCPNCDAPREAVSAVLED